ncbi:hypothetical protein BKA83DRAFT_4623670 [Pisolithus microcarpus]|nr:hypothetical protein BKA83DRAFT_4623670 [Pisolithus microcarpus]
MYVSTFRHERPVKTGGDLRKVEGEIEKRLGKDWSELESSLVDGASSRALVLLYAHFLQLELDSKALSEEQKSLLLQTLLLSNAYLSIVSVQNWLSPTLAVMLTLLGLSFPEDVTYKRSFLLRETGDERTEEAGKAFNSLPSLEVVDLHFRVIGERVVAPSSIVFLLVKLRLRDLSSLPIDTIKSEDTEAEVGGTRRKLRLETRDSFMLLIGLGYASLVPPLKIADVPLSDPSKERNYRCYKLQFQAPPNVGLFTWKVYFVSDTFVGGETCRDIVLKIDDVSALSADEQHLEDEISDPEDTLAGQMAAMRGG